MRKDRGTRHQLLRQQTGAAGHGQQGDFVAAVIAGAVTPDLVDGIPAVPVVSVSPAYIQTHLLPALHKSELLRPYPISL